MSATSLSPLEMDAIGEILNISLGSSATAVSNMLDKRVDITTPTVKVQTAEEFEFSNLEPAIGVEITYVSGLQGNNIMLLKRHDVKTIVEILLRTDIPDEEFELDEMNISAICEVMNQMMGASSTAMSEFLGTVVNISTPISFPIDNPESFKDKYFKDSNPMVIIGFTLTIEDKMESEFLNVMPVDLARALIAGFMSDTMSLDDVSDQQPAPEPEPQAPDSSLASSDSMDEGGGMLDQSMIDSLLSGVSDPEPETPSPEPTPTPVMEQTQQPNIPPQADGSQSQQVPPPPMAQPYMGQMGQPYMGQPYAQTPYGQPYMGQPMVNNVQQAPPPQPKMINVQPLQNMMNFGEDFLAGGIEQPENLQLIMGVPLELSVEIGRTTKVVKEILEYTEGSLVVLDKLAGEQVDLYVNGQCIAKGDVVVVDDNFGIRITEILKKGPL